MRKFSSILLLIGVTFSIITIVYLAINTYVNTRIPNTSQFWKAYYIQNHTDSFMNNSVLKIYQYDSLLGWQIKPNYSTNTFCNDKTFTS
ncbi:MAG: hypothetical protein KDE33_28285, partial [Bacteroidetes bacterium]|nr:hypothetical protein [Bacteroidota bacterium]